MFFPCSLPPASSLDAAMRASLADSLEYICQILKFATRCSDISLEELSLQVRTHRVSPGVFGRYYDLVFAARQQQHAMVIDLWREIVDLASCEPKLSVLPFTNDALGQDLSRYSRLLGLNQASTAILDVPDCESWHLFEDNVVAALALIREADEALADEAGSLITQVIGAGSSRKNAGGGFGGISSFMLWGAVFLNVAKHRTVLDVFEGLVHEAAHHVLFGLSVREPLVTNSPAERYDSPLRPDPRPMDGVFHATFVCARLHYALGRLRDTDTVARSSAMRREIDDRMQTRARSFHDGLDTVRCHGRLSPTGAQIVIAAADYLLRPH